MGYADRITDEAGFIAYQQTLPALRTEWEAATEQFGKNQEQQILIRGEIRRELTALRTELEGLNRRRENIPEWCVSLRQALCDELGMVARELPFAAELMRVHADEHAWESSIEKVLHNFALSMLVPEKFYRLVASHVDRTRLTANGRGQRLVYYRVAEQSQAEKLSTAAQQSLMQKLEFRDGHPLLPWVKAELSRKFDYLCCETAEEFQQSHGPALTRHRHVKSGSQWHEKDDRDHVADPRNYVLGWDNREKKQRISAEIARLAQVEIEVNRRVELIEGQLIELRDRLSALAEAAKVVAFAEIDFTRHELEIDALERERRAIEEQSDAIQELKQRLANASAHEQALQICMYALAGDERELVISIEEGKKLIENASGFLQRCESEGNLARHREVFMDLNVQLLEPPLSPDNIFERKNEFRMMLDERTNHLQASCTRKPVRNRVVDAMTKFLQVFPDESADLKPATDYLESFLGLRRRILEDDLPRHEQRFKERLNQKVIEEIALFRSALDQERRGIENKIELLNESLRKLEYRPGMHIQLEPQPCPRRRDHAEFQGKLRECVDGYFRRFGGGQRGAVRANQGSHCQPAGRRKTPLARQGRRRAALVQFHGDRHRPADTQASLRL